MLDFRIDSPAAIIDEVYKAVRRWRLGRLVAAIPAMRPSYTACSIDDTLVQLPPKGYDVSTHLPADWHEVPGTIGKLLHGKNGKCETASEWNRKMAPYLTSAITNGQWTMMRLDAVPERNGHKWVQNGTCQLCHSANGDLLHRHNCPRTLPADGWSPPPPAAVDFLSSISASNRDLLKTRGLAIARVKVPPPKDELIVWLKDIPSNVDESELSWFIDGSLLDGPLASIGRVGAGFAAVNLDGLLVAYGYGLPPPGIMTTPGSEAWALAVVVQRTVARKQVITDCMGNRDMLANGRKSATDAARPFASTWARIFDAVEDEPTNDWLVWMNAHSTRANFHLKLKSNGQAISAIEHRGNALVDELAKYAARLNRVPKYVRDYFGSAAAGILHAAAVAGAVSYASNNLEQTTTDDHGQEVTVILRDSIPLAQAARTAAKAADKLAKLTAADKKKKITDELERQRDNERREASQLAAEDRRSRKIEQVRKGRRLLGHDSC